MMDEDAGKDADRRGRVPRLGIRRPPGTGLRSRGGRRKNFANTRSWSNPGPADRAASTAAAETTTDVDYRATPADRIGPIPRRGCRRLSGPPAGRPLWDQPAFDSHRDRLARRSL